MNYRINSILFQLERRSPHDPAREQELVRAKSRWINLNREKMELSDDSRLQELRDFVDEKPHTVPIPMPPKYEGKPAATTRWRFW